MDLIPEIKTLKQKKLVGMRIATNLSANQTIGLWRAFMPRKKEILNIANQDLISMEVFDSSFPFLDFNAETPFEKWAAVEVLKINSVPAGMESFELQTGLYAVFNYKGSSSRGEEIFTYIYRKWLPGSGYRIDNRPHLAIMGEKYRNNDPNSEEELWIPIYPT